LKKIIVLFTTVLVFSAIPLNAGPFSDADAQTAFSMGYYYLYNNEFSMAIQQFELCAYHLKQPSSLVYSIIADIYSIEGEHKKSSEYALKALEIDPGNESALQVITADLIRADNYKEAVPYLEKLLEQQPDNLQALFFLAESYSELNDDEKLIEIYEKILQYRPSLIDVRLNLAFLYTKKAAFSLAEKEYKNVLQSDPENEKAIFYLTYIFLSEGRTDEALDLFAKLDRKELLSDEMLEDYGINLFVEGQNPSPIYDRINDKEKLRPVSKAILQYLQGDLDKARTLFEQSIKQDPSSIAPYVGLIKIAEQMQNVDMEKKWRFVLAGNYYNIGAYKKALQNAKRVKQIDSLFLENRYLLGDIYSAMGVTEQAIDEYRYYLDNAPEKGDAYIKLGINYDRVGKHEEAIQSFRSAVKLMPKNDELYYYLGLEYRILKDYTNALQEFLKASELKPDNAVYFFNLGICYERLGDIPNAIEYLDRSIEHDDTNAPALNYLGYLLADAGIRLDEAKAHIEKALAIDPENGAYLDSLGWVYYRLSQYEKAREYLESAVGHLNESNESDEENYLIYDHLGDAYDKLGETEEALDAWKRAVEMKDVEKIRKKIERAQREIQQ